MTEEELQHALNSLRALQGSGDIEINHYVADKILCAVLEKLGYSNIVDEWDKIEKWYA